MYLARNTPEWWFFDSVKFFLIVPNQLTEQKVTLISAGERAQYSLLVVFNFCLMLSTFLS